jgi:hypothetical protein
MSVIFSGSSRFNLWPFNLALPTGACFPSRFIFCNYLVLFALPNKHPRRLALFNYYYITSVRA